MRLRGWQRCVECGAKHSSRNTSPARNCCTGPGAELLSRPLRAHHCEQYSTSSSLVIRVASTPPMNSFPCGRPAAAACVTPRPGTASSCLRLLPTNAGGRPGGLKDPKAPPGPCAGAGGAILGSQPPATAPPHLCELDGRWLPLLPRPGLPRVAHARIIAIHAIHRGPSALAGVHFCSADAPASSTDAAGVQAGTAPAHHWIVRTRKLLVAARDPSMHRAPPPRG